MLNSTTIKVQVLCRDPLVSTGLRAALREQPDFDLEPGAATSADVIVADYEHGLDVIAAAKDRRVTHAGQQPKVLILTLRESECEIRFALSSGARGYLIQGCDLNELVTGVRAVHRGMRHVCASAAQRLADGITYATLTGREIDVVQLVSEGCGNKMIARDLDIAVGTVKSHLKAIFEKLGARSRTEVAAIAERRGLLALSPTRFSVRSDTQSAERAYGTPSLAAH